LGELLVVTTAEGEFLVFQRIVAEVRVLERRVDLIPEDVEEGGGASFGSIALRLSAVVEDIGSLRVEALVENTVLVDDPVLGLAPALLAEDSTAPVGEADDEAAGVEITSLEPARDGACGEAEDPAVGDREVVEDWHVLRDGKGGRVLV
jgi:hypothetical protein